MQNWAKAFQGKIWNSVCPKLQTYVSFNHFEKVLPLQIMEFPLLQSITISTTELQKFWNKSWVRIMFGIVSHLQTWQWTEDPTLYWEAGCCGDDLASPLPCPTRPLQSHSGSWDWGTSALLPWLQSPMDGWIGKKGDRAKVLEHRP